MQPNNPLHALEGWKHLATARIPEIYDSNLADEHLVVDSDQAFNLIRFIADHEGIYISPSGAANLLGAVDVASRVRDAEIVTTLADTLDRYKEVHKEIFSI